MVKDKRILYREVEIEMKMITKVFLVIAVLLICLILWALFLGGNGVLENAWNGIAGQVNETWQAITGTNNNVLPEWKTGTVEDGVEGGIDDINDAN